MYFPCVSMVTNQAIVMTQSLDSGLVVKDFAAQELE